MKRIKSMVERILARCRQCGATLKGLTGVTLGTSPTKDRNVFVDIHAEANQAPKKSWHFSIKEIPKPQAKSSKKSKMNKDITTETETALTPVNL